MSVVAILCAVGVCEVVFFFSSRRRHTRCALVTGVQTCALPIWLVDSASHLARLERSTGAIGIALPLSLAEVEAAQKELVARNGLTEGLVYLQITRGADATRAFLPSPGIAPTLVMFVQAKPFLDDIGRASGREKGCQNG